MDNQISSVLTVYAAMLADLLQGLVRRGALSPADGEAIVRRGQSLLSQAPTQGETTDAAMKGLDQLARSIAATPPR